VTDAKQYVCPLDRVAHFFLRGRAEVKKGENHYKLGHVESFTYSQCILRGDVHASMRNKVYKVTVSGNGSRIVTIDAACHLFAALKCFSVRFLSK